MSFIPNAGVVLKKAWSAWLLYLMIFLSALEAGLPFVIDDFDIPPGSSALLTALISSLALLARVTYQPEVHVVNDKPPESSE
jgi:hypothetical protein